MTQKTVSINGIAYDAHTGLPVRMPAASASQPVSARQSFEVHRQTERSRTLNRRVVTKKASQPIKRVEAVPAVHKSPAITKFALHPVGAAPHPRSMDIGPSVHPVVKKAHARMQPAVQPQRPAHQPASVVKQQVVSETLAKAPSHKAASKPVKSRPRSASRVMSIVSASLALLLLGGYFTYLNMPSLSVRVAAAQAGVQANYPSYHPDGYGRGSVAYQDGEVSVKFASNSGPQSFTITQQKTTWDSTAVKENYVAKKWGDNIDIVTDRGLTIYRKDSSAVWVNGGVLYKISGNAPLTPSQIRNIATSM